MEPKKQKKSLMLIVFILLGFVVTILVVAIFFFASKYSNVPAIVSLYQRSLCTFSMDMDGKPVAL